MMFYEPLHLLFSATTFNQNKFMKSIARWSSKHVFAARIVIAICHILIAGIAYFVGTALELYDKIIPIELFFLSAFAFAIIFFIVEQVGYKRISFYKRKVLDFAIILCSFVMMMALANHKTPTHFTTYPQVQGSFSKVQTDPIAKPSVKELKKQFKDLRQNIKKEKPSAGAVVGAILIGLLLGWIVLSAACSLSCNGQDGLAAFVAVGGVVVIFFVLKLILKSGQRRRKDVEPTPKQQIN
jgi:Kef-type K+ transport system membrane component KefB